MNVVHSTQLPWPQDVMSVVAALGRLGDLAFLDTSTPLITPADDRDVISLVAVNPILTIGDDVKRGESWARWRRLNAALPRLEAVGPGWIGYCGFESAGEVERLPALDRDIPGIPRFRMGLFDAAIVIEHKSRVVTLVSAPQVAAALGRRASDIEALRVAWESGCAGRPVAVGAHSVPTARFESTAREHETRVARALEYIAAGDIYQVNLAHRILVDGIGSAASAYSAMRDSNPAAYGALLTWQGGGIASVSPELFLRVRGRDVLTSPIKGTRPRRGDAAADAQAQGDLLTSEKEAAELAMIVDLHRNDLGRVCEYGSVRVRDPRRIEAHPTVFHTVADITGRLAMQRNAIDLLAACFPAGSVTGVPKLRAMEIIAELEPAARGAYTGAIGHLGFNGDATFSVAIRTLQIAGHTGYLHVGGGIVAESAPADEYCETLAKGRGILRGLGLAAAMPPS